MAQEISYFVLTVETNLQYQASPCGNCGQNSTETGFILGNLSFCPVTIIPLVHHAHLCITDTIYYQQFTLSLSNLLDTYNAMQF